MINPLEVNRCVAIYNNLKAVLNLGVAYASRVSLRVGLKRLEKLGVAGIQFPRREHSLLHLTQIPKSMIPFLFYQNILALCSGPR